MLIKLTDTSIRDLIELQTKIEGFTHLTLEQICNEAIEDFANRYRCVNAGWTSYLTRDKSGYVSGITHKELG